MLIKYQMYNNELSRQHVINCITDRNGQLKLSTNQMQLGNLNSSFNYYSRLHLLKSSCKSKALKLSSVIDLKISIWFHINTVIKISKVTMNTIVVPLYQLYYNRSLLSPVYLTSHCSTY